MTLFGRRFAYATWMVAVVVLLTGCQSTPKFDLGQQEKPPVPAQTDPEPALDAESEVAWSPYQDGAATVGSVRAAPLDPNAPIRIAVLLPLSGRADKVGQSLLNAAQMALFEFAADRLELRVHDTQGSPAGAMTAVQLAINEGAAVVLGPLFGDSVRAVAPILNTTGIPGLAFSNDITAAQPGVYVMGFLPEQEVDTVVRYAIAQGLVRLAALAPSSAYGDAAVEAMRRAAEELGAEVVKVAYYDAVEGEATDAIIRELADFETRSKELADMIEELETREDEASKNALKRLEKMVAIGEYPFDALLLADGGRRLQPVAALVSHYDIDPGQVQMLGTSRWDVAGIGTEPQLLGAWYAAPPDAARVGFIERYTATFGAPPSRIATLAYDAVALVATLAVAEGGPTFDPEVLTNPSGFVGRDGIFRFLAHGGNQRGYAIKEVRERENRILEPAPQTFPALLY